jgi:hypothetical protein
MNAIPVYVPADGKLLLSLPAVFTPSTTGPNSSLLI